MTVSDTSALTESVAVSAPGALRFWVGGTATWDATVGTKWATATGGAGGAAIPIAADDVRFDANSGANTVTLSASSVGRSIDCTAFTGTISHPASTTVNIGDATAGQGNIALKIVSGMAGYTVGAAGSSVLNFVSTSATVQTVASGTKVMPSMTFNGVAGSWQFADNITATGATITLTNGTLDMNSKTVNLGTISVGAGTKILTLGTASITLTAGWSATAAGLTTTANSATVTQTGAGVGFDNGGAFGSNYNGMSLVQSGSGTSVVGSSNVITLANYTRTGTAAKTDVVNIGPNLTVTGTLALNGNSATNRLLVQSSTFGTQKTITVGTFAAANASHVDFQDISIVNSTLTRVKPASDVSNAGGWTQSTGASLWATIDEDTSDTSDFVTSPADQLTESFEVGLASASAATYAVLTATFACNSGSGAYTLQLTLKQGSTVIATSSATGNAASNATTTVSYTLTAAEIASITDWTALSIQVTKAVVSSVSRAVTVYWVQLQTSNADLSAITGLSGDCGNNIGITFTTGATQYVVGSGSISSATVANFASSSGGSGSTGRVPLPQDTVRLDASTPSGVTYNLGMPRNPGMNSAGMPGTTSFAQNLGGGPTIYGSVDLSGFTTITQTVNIIFRGRKGTVNTFKCPASWPATGGVQVSAWADTTWQLQYDFASLSAGGLLLNSGIFDANGYNLTVVKVTSTAALARTVHMGSGTWTLTSTVAETIFDLNTPSTLTVDGKATIVVANASANTRTFNVQQKAYGTLRYDVSGSTGLLVIAAGTAGAGHQFDLIIVGPGRAIRFQPTTQTFTVGTLVWRGVPGSIITVDSGTAGVSVPVVVRTPTDADYLSMRDIAISGGNGLHYAGDHSTNTSNNTGWTFRSAPRANRALALRRR